MSAITGYISTKPTSPTVIQKMTNALIHRGPDKTFIYTSQDKKYNIGQNTLAFDEQDTINVLPDETGNVVISLDGRLSNYLVVKELLESAFTFQTNTDEELILYAYKKWGAECVDKLEGMFAFTLLDEVNRKLLLVRDRFGTKPLYYTVQDEELLFASELKGILAADIIKKEIDYSAFSDFFVYRYVPSPKTIWKNVKKLPPAHYVEINLTDLSCKLTEYWKLDTKALPPSESLSREIGRDKGRIAIIHRINNLLKNSVQQHINTNASIGSFLSGGYDSSALVHYMCQLGQKPTTFSIGFSKWEKSEDQFAKIVANHLGVENESVIADEHSLELVEKMPVIYDEPIADISIVPTFMVGRLAKTKVNSVLSGEGADELFGGYTWQYDFFQQAYPQSLVEKLKRKLFKKDTVSFYAQAMAMGWFDKEELKKMLQPHLHQYIPEDVHWFYRQHFNRKATPLKSIQQMDVKCFMGELVLTKVDRASMANSLEVRAPFLDHHLFEYVFSLDERTYFKPSQTKYLLYKNIENALPATILNRKKQGFVGPDAYYMNIEWYKEHFKDSKLVALNIVRQEYINDLLKETYNWKLWKLLIMEKWVKEWL